MPVSTLLICLVIVGLCVLFFPLDLFRTKEPLQRPSGRVDERDVVFGRMARDAGTAEYEEYYSRRPELKKEDDRIRNMPGLMKPGALYYHPRISGRAEEYFNEILQIEPDPSVLEVWRERIADSHDSTGAVREMILELGAVAVGIAPLGQEYIYTHKGRFAYDYGCEIELDHPSVILFLVEMDFNEMSCAPMAEVIRESARQYYRAAVISKTAEAVLRAAGASARSHHDAHYDIILPPLAVAAGLGEVGRNNFLIADRYGSRVRIGAVTTDLVLRYDSPIYLGADHFCTICRKCADNCPSRALSTGEKEDVLGVRKWPTGVEQCYAYWRYVGSDCSICMVVCPFSHRNNWFHNTIRMAVKLNLWIRHIALFFDNLVYGRRFTADRESCESA